MRKRTTWWARKHRTPSWTTGARRASCSLTARTEESCQGGHQLPWCRRRRIHDCHRAMWCNLRAADLTYHSCSQSFSTSHSPGCSCADPPFVTSFRVTSGTFTKRSRRLTLINTHVSSRKQRTPSWQSVAGRGARKIVQLPQNATITCGKTEQLRLPRRDRRAQPDGEARRWPGHKILKKKEL
jgi:hypothetical protein